WALKDNQKLDNRGSTKIKKNIKAMLEHFFLSKNLNNQERIGAQTMHAELLEYAN
ncbi:12510_t:CDS:1, partial [Cetraspora pellucida]